MSQLQIALHRFAADERGGISNLLLPMFMLLILTTGLALDLAEHETERADLQDALDRGVLAASSLTQTIDATTVVQDYVDNRTFNSIPVTANVSTTSTDGSRRVEASAVYDRPTTFLRIAGETEMAVPGVAEAIEGFENIEISLVLDISGSMARYTSTGTSQTRLEVLRTAAKSFVTQMLTGSDRQHVSISLVPYAGNVNAGAFYDTLTGGVKDMHASSSCVDFTDADYDTPSLPASGTRSQAPQFQWFQYEGFYGYEADWGWCPKDTDATAGQEIVPFSDDEVALHAEIDALRGHDGTGTQNGMKWGLALLDPNTQPITSTLVSSGQVSADFAERPVNYFTPGTYKIIVLMTDGDITFQNRPSDAELAIEERRDYWATPDLSMKFGFVYPWNAMYLVWASAGINNPAFSQQPDVNYLETVDRPLRVQQFLQLCAMAYERQVRVFTIGFDVLETDAAYQEMRQCASAPGDFFHVEGLDLVAAFDQIATLVQKLTLVR